MDLSSYVNSVINIPGVQFTIDDNQLNDYDRYAYHFTLSLVGERDSQDPNIAERLRIDPQTPIAPAPALPDDRTPVRKIIVAQSGVTVGLNITSVNIEDSVNTNLRYKNNASTQISMVITEPYGINLIDQLFNASRDLGIVNWRLAPLFLELEFKGYKEDGTLVSASEFKIRKVWKIVIIEMEGTLTQVGTTYKITAAAQNTIGFLDHYFLIPATQKITIGVSPGLFPRNLPATPLSLPGAGSLPTPINISGTIGSFFTKLGEELTKYYVEQRQSNALIPLLVYDFKIADEIAKQEINTDLYANGRRMPFASLSPDGRDLIVSRGISITALLDDLISSTKVPDPDNPWFLIDRTTGLVLIPRVECVVKNIGFDFLNNDYVRQFTFVVSAKQTTRPTMTRDIGRDLQTPPQSQNPRFNNQLERLKQISRVSLNKAYPYYYTGRNTEIINLNIAFQNMHVIPLPLITSTQRAQADAQALAQAATIQQQIEQAQRSRAGQQLTPDAERQFNEYIADLRRQQAALLGSQDQLVIFDPAVAAQLNFPGNDNLRQQFLRDQRSNLDALAARRRREFAEDIVTNRLDPGEYTYIADPRDIANLLSRPASPAAPGQRQDSARQYYTTILSQIYDRSLNQLTEIEMDIKGDPYWLGKSNLEREQELSKILQGAGDQRYFGSDTVAGTANYYNYDAHFLLLFRGGQVPDEATGYMKLDKSVYFTAIYQTITVLHKFENGVFTQKLTAVRDSLLNLNGLRPGSAPTP